MLISPVVAAAALPPPALLTAWPEDPLPHAAASSFGLSGTNTHLCLAAAPCCPVPPRPSPPPGRRWHVLCLSAHTPAALQRVARAHAERCAGEEALPAVCQSALRHRGHALPCRLAVVAPTSAALCQALRAYPQAAALEDAAIAVSNRPISGGPAIALLFPEAVGETMKFLTVPDVVFTAAQHSGFFFRPHG